MYHAVIARIGRRNFERVNSHDYAAILKGCAPDIEHRFGGNHALGGIRHSREALGRWFARMGRVAPSLKLTVEDIWSKAAHGALGFSSAGTRRRCSRTADPTPIGGCT